MSTELGLRIRCLTARYISIYLEKWIIEGGQRSRGTVMRNVVPTMDENRKAVEALAALAQESRLAIFRLLVQQGPEGLAAGEIADRLGLPGATLSFHLKELAHAQLVAARQAGRFIYYSANYQAMNGLIDYLTRNCCQGATCDIACAPAAQRRRRA